MKAASKARLFGTLLAAGVSAWPAPVQAAPVRTPGAACALAKTRVSEQRGIPASRVASCETIRVGGLRGFYVLALYGRCREDVCGSVNMGWFAVQKGSGRVFEWDVGEHEVGQPIASRP